MTQANENGNGKGGDFKWGNKKGVGARNSGTQFYDSFYYEGVQYSLYDCVYFCHTFHVETSIGKLVKIYERPNHEKMVKVVWFFRPTEIRKFLGTYQPRWNELFLASGVGTGLSNVNFLESIMGKCNVVCTSEDIRNPKPSETELERADFFFKYGFDVQKRVIVDKFTDEIDGFKVEQFFNRKGDKKISSNLHLGTNKKPKIVIKRRTDPSVSLCNQVKDKDEARTFESVSPSKSLNSSPPKKRKFIEEKTTITQNTPKKVEFREKEDLRQATPKKDGFKEKEDLGQATRIKGEFKEKEYLRHATPKKGEFREKEDLRQATRIKGEFKEKEDLRHATLKKGEFREKEDLRQATPMKGEFIEKEDLRQATPKKSEFKEKEELGQASIVTSCREVIEVTERPGADKRKWFKNMPWAERLQKAKMLNTLVLLGNLDPSYTSYEVEDLVWHALKEKVEARMIEWNWTSDIHYGRALIIFKTKDAAEHAVSELTNRCLTLENGRVVFAWKPNLRDPDKQCEFFGHFTIDEAAFQKKNHNHEMRNAVSTSHCSQPNTIEYAMAIEWMHENEKSDASWNALYQRQIKEIDDVKSKLKMDFLKTHS